MKSFVGFARVSSREQEREGFSLDVQEEALQRYAKQQDGKIVQLFRVAETASTRQERETFRELLSYVKKHKAELAGVLFYKVDRAARNMFDWLEVERIESELEVPAIFVTQPSENNPAGRMMRRTLANMASFFTEQMSVDISEGMSRRVKSGLFPGLAPYGYRNTRINDRGLVEIDEREAAVVKRIFELYISGIRVEELSARLFADGICYTERSPRFPRNTLYKILKNRAYIGEVSYKENVYPGVQSPILERRIWNRAQELMGNRICRSHELTYSGKLIKCAHCDGFITGELIQKKSGREYVFYRCSRNNKVPGHPQVRLPERELDRQVLNLFEALKIQDNRMRRLIGTVIRERAVARTGQNRERVAALRQQLTKIERQQDQLLNVALAGEFEAGTVARKGQELRDQAATLKAEIEAACSNNDDHAAQALNTFELSQVIKDKWLTADYASKRKILEIIGLNWRLEDTTLVATIRKPFDLLINQAILKNGGGEGI